MRAGFTVLAIVLGLLVAWAVFMRTPPGAMQPRTTPAPTAPPQMEDAPEPAAAAAAQPATLQAAAAPAAPTTPAAPIPGLRVRGGARALVSTIGSLTSNAYRMEVQLSGWGASVSAIRLADYPVAALDSDPYVVQSTIQVMAPGGGTYHVYPMAARAIVVNGRAVDLMTARWEKIGEGRYQVHLVDESDTPVVRITRQYSIDQGSSEYDLRLAQSVENLGSQPLQIIWEQNAQADVPLDSAAYMGDRRMLVTGYYLPSANPARNIIFSDNAFVTRHDVVSRMEKAAGATLLAPNRVVSHGAIHSLAPSWPNADVTPDAELVWFGTLNRYFGAVVHQARPAANTGAAAQFVVQPLDTQFATLGAELIEPRLPHTQNQLQRYSLMYTLTSKPLTIAPGQAADLSMSLYAGPLKREVFHAAPVYQALRFEDLIVYQLGCTLCTFQPIARGLLAFLKVIYVGLRDWGVAIIVLVLVVRLVLHPITKKSQINITKMSKQMAALQPEMERLKKQYKDDPTRMNQEVWRLQRERGVNPLNALGCLPMFLQMPIWVALYAMLYYAIELRTQPAFYGVFQAISGGNWAFLADLSEPDRFITFGRSFTIPLFFVNPTFGGINVIPLLMAVFFFLQQKWTMPPAMNEQQAQQQKIAKWMMLLIPVFLYSAPSGLTLYMLASSIAGMIDSHIVRKHIKEQEEKGTLFQPRKPPKPGGLMDRFQKMVQNKQAEMQYKQQEMQRGRDRKR